MTKAPGHYSGLEFRTELACGLRAAALLLWRTEKNWGS